MPGVVLRLDPQDAGRERAQQRRQVLLGHRLERAGGDVAHQDAGREVDGGGQGTGGGAGEDLDLDAELGQPPGGLDDVDVHAAGVAGAGLVEGRGVDREHGHPRRRQTAEHAHACRPFVAGTWGVLQTPLDRTAADPAAPAGATSMAQTRLDPAAFPCEGPLGTPEPPWSNAISALAEQAVPSSPASGTGEAPLRDVPARPDVRTREAQWTGASDDLPHRAPDLARLGPRRRRRRRAAFDIYRRDEVARWLGANPSPWTDERAAHERLLRWQSWLDDEPGYGLWAIVPDGVALSRRVPRCWTHLPDGEGDGDRGRRDRLAPAPRPLGPRLRHRGGAAPAASTRATTSGCTAVNAVAYPGNDASWP